MTSEWAIVELMGRVQMAGRVSEEQRFGAILGRVDIPEGDGDTPAHGVPSVGDGQSDRISEGGGRAVMEAVIRALRIHRFTVSSEVELQECVGQALSDAGVEHRREVHITDRDIIDFMAGAIGIEVKVDGSAPALLRQLHRYAQHEAVEGLVVVTNRRRLAAMPNELNGKPVLALNVGGWV